MLLPEVEGLASGWVGAAVCPKISSSVELNEARAEDVAGVAMGSRGAFNEGLGATGTRF